jgi:agarase
LSAALRGSPRKRGAQLRLSFRSAGPGEEDARAMVIEWLLIAVLTQTSAPSQAPIPPPAPAVAPESASPDATGFFHAELRNGRWWLVDPSGQLFLSKGVASVQFAPDADTETRRSQYEEAARAKYGTLERWRVAVARRLSELGFNTVGAFSDEKVGAVDLGGRHLASAPIVDFVGRYVLLRQHMRAWVKGIFPDVFDPDFAAFAQLLVRERCTAQKDDPWLLGWFTDNELRWGPDWRGKDELLTMFLGLPAAAPGRQAAVKLLRERYGDVQKFDAAWEKSYLSWESLESAGPIPAPKFAKRSYRRDEESEPANSADDAREAAFSADCDAFLAELAERYFQVTADAIRAADPNHMVLGCRFAYVPAKVVVAAAARHVSVISFNAYTKDPRWSIGQYAPFEKPLLIGEFSFRGRDSGLPNLKGCGPLLLPTQAERAAAFNRYAWLALSHPNVVGYHWFQHADEPVNGRFDGEDSNNGLVDVRDELYEVLARKMAKVNGEAEAVHAR